MNQSVRITAWAIIALAIFGATEIASYVGVVTLKSSTPFMFYDPPVTTKEAYLRYMEARDSALGWPRKSAYGTELYDQSGARPSPAISDRAPMCLSLYGDSFTYGDDVRNEEAWGNILAGLLGCRVANFGVGGYGTDQAFLRFRENRTDSAPITLLGIFPENLLRNVNQYMFLINKADVFSLKPRFVYDGGTLKLVPLPLIPWHQWSEFAENPARFLPQETFLPGSALGPVVMSFPYSKVLLELVLNERIFNRLLGKPSWSSFATSGHRSHASETTLAIVREFRAQCQLRHKTCAVLVFPSTTSIRQYERTGNVTVQPLLDGLETMAIPYLDLTGGLIKKLAGRDVCSIKPAGCVGHFTPEGYAVIAVLVQEYLRRNDMIQKLETGVTPSLSLRKWNRETDGKRSPTLSTLTQD